MAQADTRRSADRPEPPKSFGSVPYQFGWPEGVFRSNFTEYFGNMQSSQPQTGNAKPRCAEFELNALECLEAYGARRGRIVCYDYLDDHQECVFGNKQMYRAIAMRKERMRQVLRGERPVSQFYDRVKPPRDSFQEGPYHP